LAQGWRSTNTSVSQHHHFSLLSNAFFDYFEQLFNQPDLPFCWIIVTAVGLVTAPRQWQTTALPSNTDNHGPDSVCQFGLIDQQVNFPLWQLALYPPCPLSKKFCQGKAVIVQKSSPSPTTAGDFFTGGNLSRNLFLLTAFCLHYPDAKQADIVDLPTIEAGQLIGYCFTPLIKYGIAHWGLLMFWLTPTLSLMSYSFVNF
jgi:hypothetical protein